MVRATLIILNQALSDIPVLFMILSKACLHSSSSGQYFSVCRFDISALVLMPSPLNLAACRLRAEQTLRATSRLLSALPLRVTASVGTGCIQT